MLSVLSQCNFLYMITIRHVIYWKYENIPLKVEIPVAYLGCVATSSPYQLKNLSRLPITPYWHTRTKQYSFKVYVIAFPSQIAFPLTNLETVLPWPWNEFTHQTFVVLRGSVCWQDLHQGPLCIYVQCILIYVHKYIICMYWIFYLFKFYALLEV